MRTEELKDKLSVAERESLQRDISIASSMIESSKGLRTIEVDPRVKREMIRKRMLLAKDDEVSSLGERRAALEAEHKKLKEIIRREIPRKGEMWPGKDQHDKNQALQHNLEFQRKYEDVKNYKTDDGQVTSVVLRYKQLDRMLNPENPFAGNLDALREN